MLLAGYAALRIDHHSGVTRLKRRSVLDTIHSHPEVIEAGRVARPHVARTSVGVVVRTRVDHHCDTQQEAGRARSGNRPEKMAVDEIRCCPVLVVEEYGDVIPLVE